MIVDHGGARRRFAALAVVVAAAFAALHLPFLPQSLDDLDSINFALGLRRFDVALHQPHPPGYPVFIALARLVASMVRSEVTALAGLAILSGTLGALAIVWLHREMFGGGRGWSLGAATIAVTAPLYWVTAARPLSDMAGLAAAVAVQAMTLGARSANAMAGAAFCAGLAAGIRSQVFWLTAPLLVWTAVAHTGAEAPAARARAGAGFLAGVLVWLAPLVWMTGGAGAYWRAVASQGGEDLSGIRMLWTTPTPRELLDALYYAFVAPWAVWPAAIAVIAAAAMGAVALWRRNRRALAILAVTFGPYFVFDVLFQETFTSRYALPLVVPVGFLAARGIQTWPVQPALVAIVLVAAWNAHVGGRSVAAIASEPAPVFRLLADMKAANAEAAVLAPDRRQSFDLRRPLKWLEGEAPRYERQLPSPPQHEWLEAVKYWNNGGRAPVWFVVDPRRAAIDLVQHAAPSEYRWSLPYPVLVSGTRPGDADWYRVDRPDWYAGEGWALSPESAGVADKDRRGLQYGPIEAWARRAALDGGALVVGGRNFESTGDAALSIDVEGVSTRTLSVPPGAFLELIRLPGGGQDRALPEYVKVSVAAAPPARIAIEQFDVAPIGRAVLGFGDGWHERELDPATGRQWRWLSGRGELSYLAPERQRAWTLHVEGESPQRYYSKPSRLIFRSGGRVLREATVAADFTVDVELPRAIAPSTLIVETDQTHVPAQSSWRGSADRRVLGLRVFRCELR